MAPSSAFSGSRRHFTTPTRRGFAEKVNGDSHTPENCDDENLRAWCQRCHLTYDAKHHAQNAYATRRGRKADGDLFA